MGFYSILFYALLTDIANHVVRIKEHIDKTLLDSSDD